MDVRSGNGDVEELVVGEEVSAFASIKDVGRPGRRYGGD
jgi:hypothetical protein